MAEPKTHEQRDIPLKKLLIVAGLLTASAVVIHLAIAGLLWAFVALGGTSGQEPRHPAPAPMRQAPTARALEQAARARLASEGPAGQPGRRHIPIDEAIERVVARGWAAPQPRRKVKP